MGLDANIWGPHYWFVLHTMAISYPLNPSSVTKKKYYDFIQNLPIFLPISEIGNTFSKFLDKYPVTPYLDSRESFMKWVHFIHNRINIALRQPEITMTESLNHYYQHYKPKEILHREHIKQREKYIYFGIMTLVIVSTIYLYKN